jgi:hypothetical protein
MADLTQLVEQYLAIWNEPDADARTKSIEGLWAEDGGYVDPMAAVRGHEGVAAVVSGARDQFPGFVFALLSPPDVHHNIARFTWELKPAAGGESLVIGFDVAVFTEDGRIQDVFGFLDKVPAA